MNTFDKNEIIPAFIPKSVMYRTKQAIGKNSQSCVKIGDRINEGAIISSTKNLFETHIHSSIPGRIKNIIQTENDVEIYIDYEGTIESKNQKPHQMDNIEINDILEKIKSSGIIRQKDYNIPIFNVIELARKKNIDKLIISGFDNRKKIISFLINHKINEIHNGIKVLEKVLMLEKIKIYLPIGIKHKLKTKKNNKIKIIKLLNNKKYHYKIKNRKIFPKNYISNINSLSIIDNCLLLSIEDVINIYNAVMIDKPYIEKILPINLNNKLYNIKVKFGVFLKDICNELNIEINNYEFFINNNENKITNPNNYTIDKTTEIIHIKNKEIDYTPTSECCKCNRCVEVCPVGINPRRLLEYISNNKKDMVKYYNIEKCIKCGLCNEVCHSNIDLRKVFEEYK